MAWAQLPTPQQWREDLAYLAERIEMQHPNAFATMDRSQFEAAVAKLNADIPSLQAHEIAFAMIRLAAMVGDGHTRMHLPQAGKGDEGPADELGFHRLPISFYQFSDGLFVRHVGEAHRDLAGRKVIRIGNATAPEAMEAVAPLVHPTRVIRQGIHRGCWTGNPGICLSQKSYTDWVSPKIANRSISNWKTPTVIVKL